MKILNISGREIYDNNGLPTLCCEVMLEGGLSVIASVPAGTSVGFYEARELRDGGKRLFGLGVLQAIHLIESVIAPALIGKSPDVMQADLLMVQLDGTKDKSYLGANTTLAVSLAIARAQAVIEKMELFELVAHLMGHDSVTIPFPLVNVISGGPHAHNKLLFQEMMIVPLGADSYRAALEIVAVITAHVEKIFKKRNIFYTLSIEGAFAPYIDEESVALDILLEALEQEGSDACAIALDVNASGFYNPDKALYQLHNELCTSSDMINLYKELVLEYPIFSIEDGLDQNDLVGWSQLTQTLGDRVQIVGDDVFSTNVNRLRQGLELGVATAIVIKPNQVGTITESLDTLMLAKQHSMNTIASHRSRETTDSFIVDLAVGSSVGQIKLGGFREGRMAKYNRLLMIEDILMSGALE